MDELALSCINIIVVGGLGIMTDTRAVLHNPLGPGLEI